MPKQKAVYCWQCGKMTRQIYMGREKDGIAKEVVLGIISLGWNTLLNLAAEEKLGGTTFWECTKCGSINED